MTTPSAESAADLRERMRGVALPRLASDIELSLVTGEQVPHRKLQLHAESEPGLALEILRRANARLREDDEPRGVQQGIHLLGLAQMQGLMRSQRSARKLDLAAPGHRLCLSAMAASRLGWLYLAPWLRSGLASDEDQRLSIVILMGIARWKLPLLEPELAQRMELRVEAGERRARVEQELLGLSLDQLSAWHLQDLGFPQVPALEHALRIDAPMLAAAARHGWTRDFAPAPPPEVAQALRQRYWGCSLAHALALETRTDWYSARTAHLLAAISAWQRRPIDEVLRSVQRQAVIASGEAWFSRGVRAPAVGLLWPPREPRSLGRAARLAAAQTSTAPVAGVQALPTAAADGGRSTSSLSLPASSTAPPATAAAESTLSVAPPPSGAARLLAPGPDLLPAYLQRCSTASYSDLRELLGDSLLLFAQFGLRRSALFLRQTGSEHLACYVAKGFAANVAPRGLALAPGERGLIAHLLSQPGTGFWIQPAQIAGIASKLPRELLAWPLPCGFALAGVHARERSFGFWWADPGSDGEPLSATGFAALRRAAGAFGPEFVRLMREQRQAASKPG